MARVTPDVDAVVIGAGISGMHMLKTLRDKLGRNRVAARRRHHAAVMLSGPVEQVQRGLSDWRAKGKRP